MEADIIHVYIFRQVKEMEADNPEADILDQIESMYIHEKRTRRQIGNKLRDLGLITSIMVEEYIIYI